MMKHLLFLVMLSLDHKKWRLLYKEIKNDTGKCTLYIYHPLTLYSLLDTLTHISVLSLILVASLSPFVIDKGFQHEGFDVGQELSHLPHNGFDTISRSRTDNIMTATLCHCLLSPLSSKSRNM